MKVSDSNENTTKNKILNVAEALFAEKGFDGTSMGEIAKKVGINKSSIYYYFESKDKLLEEVLKNCTINFAEKRKTYDIAQKSELTDEDIALVIKEHLDFLKEKRNILIIALTEALKENNSSSALFNMIDLLYDRLLVDAKNMNPTERIDKTFKLKGFIFKILPVLASAIFNEKWSAHYDLKPEEFNELIIKIMMENYKKNNIECIV